MEKQSKIDAAVALELWNSGLSAAKIAARFPGVTRSAARWIVLKAARQSERRTGKYKSTPAVPPLAALWS